jgi:regulator of nucleoside diphosphate kinase
LKETAVRDRPIVITKSDAAKLRELLAARARAEHDQDHLHELAAELERALIAEPEADLNAGRISVLAPLGTALLGYREGDEVEWQMPGGLRQLRIERVRRLTEDRVARRREVPATAVG